MTDDGTGRQAGALHVFDMDGTLLAGSACLDLSARAGYLSSVEEMEEAWGRGEIGHVEFYDLLIPLWSELTHEDVDETFAKAGWIEGLREVFSDIRSRGERSAVVSLSPHFFVRRLQAWGLDYAFGAGVEIGEPVLPERVYVPETKVAVVADLLAELRLGEDRCVVYGDSSSDVPLFQRFPNSIAVNASSSLLPFAHVTYEGPDLTSAYALGRSLLGDEAEEPPAMSPTSSATLLPPGHRIPVAHRDMKIFGGRSNPRLAEEIGVRLGVGLSPVTLRSFSGGEVYCRYEESIRGSDVFLIQSLSANAESGIGTNDALAELLVMIDAAKGASAHRVTAVVPWFGYSRQDKKSAAREPISARLMARILEASGADRVLTMDLHAPQIQGMFQIPVDHMTASLALSDHILRLRLQDELVVVAPDAGRGKHARAFATMVGAGFAILDKQRPAQQQAEIGYVIGDVEGKTAIVVDDIIDTAGTIRAAAEAVLGAGANRVHVVATHGVFSGKAYENIASSGVERFFVTDTIAAPPGVPSNVEIISCADVLAESMVQIFTCGSVSAVFRGHNHVY